MKLAIYTTELTRANAHLMPWRTVLEVASQWQNMHGAVLVLSGDRQTGEEVIAGIRVAHVHRPKGEPEAAGFCARLVEEGVHGVYFPVAPGSLYMYLAQLLRRSGVSLTWYYPGAWYTHRQVLRAMRVMSLRKLLPYIYQALIPKRFWLARLKALGNYPMIAMTDYTADQLRAHGYPADRIFAIPPGKAPVAQRGEVSSACIHIEQAVGDARFFLFFGPPNPIRGVYHLLDAFSNVSRNHPDVKLVCLFRGDNNVDSTVIRARVARMDLGDRLIAHWQSVGPADLDRLLKRCYAVLKPFVIVPSEIPLAVIETAEYGKPVIGFEGDGTGEFIGRFGLVAKHGDSDDLARKMQRLLDESAFYDERCQAAHDVYAAHPDWREVAEMWLRTGLV